MNVVDQNEQPVKKHVVSCTFNSELLVNQNYLKKDQRSCANRRGRLSGQLTFCLVENKKDRR